MTLILSLFLPLLAIARSSLALSSSPPPPPSRVFIGGLGYCGARIARAFRDAYGSECAIAGTVRSSERRDALLTSPPDWLNLDGGDAIHVLDMDDEYSGLSPDGVRDLELATHVVQTVAPIADFDRDPLLALHGKVLKSSKHLQYVGYLSSTGVYGDYGGGWVTEESEMRCVDAKSKARIEAEREWGQLERSGGEENRGTRADFFRCGGIYGPGRGPLFSTVAKLDEALVSGEEETLETPKYVNRILVDDICGAIVTAVSSDRPCYDGIGRAYNLVDDNPAPRRDVVSEARRLLLPADTENSPKSTGERRGKRRVTRNTGNKRCRNSRLKEEYGWEPRAPTYKEGLALLLENEVLTI